MNLSIHGIQSPLNHGHKSFKEQVGRICQRCVKVFKDAAMHLRTNALVAIGTTVAANILFAITTFKIVDLIFKKNDEMKNSTFATVFLGIPLASVAGLNTAFYCTLKPRIHPAAFGAISFATFTGTYILSCIISKKVRIEIEKSQ